MTIQYTPRGTCSRHFQIEVEEGVIQSIQVEPQRANTRVAKWGRL